MERAKGTSNSCIASTRAAYGRTPDEGGLRFWTGVMDGRGPGAPDAADQEYLASFFLTANEFINLYGSNPTDYQYIDAMYANVLEPRTGPGRL